MRQFIAVATIAIGLSSGGCDRAQEDRAAGAASEAVHNVSKTLQQAGDVAREGARETRNVLTDGGLTAKVKTALVAAQGVNGTAVDVDTSGGVVTLSGNLPDRAQVDRAIQVAREVDGVKSVESKLKVAGQG